jgi:dUTP pyrophosphatase
MKLLIKKLSPDATIPRYARPLEAGLDLYSNETVVLQPNEKKTIKTGIALALPPGHVGLVWDRSGLASKFHLHTFAGVIDETYRGELSIVIGNFGTQPYTIEKNTRIAQLLVQPIVQPEVNEVTELSETNRGSGGFGSTGLK